MINDLIEVGVFIIRGFVKIALIFAGAWLLDLLIKWLMQVLA